MSYFLRPYQTAALEAVDAAFVANDSTLVEMATGLGKTVLFSHIADRWPGPVLVIAHRDELIRQAAEKIYSITRQPCAIEMGREHGGNEVFKTKVVVGSVQTLSKANRLERYHHDFFSLVIVDEGHHATASSYRSVLDYFAKAKKLFVTATPTRGDGIALGMVCESVAYQYGIEPAIHDGWLVPVMQTVVKVDGLDFSKARTLAGDFNEADLEKILTQEKELHEMCSSGNEIVGDRQALWFCVNVAHSQAVAGVLSRYSLGGVRFLSGKTDKDERRQAVKDYKKGRIQHLVNCGLFLEGFDAPATSVVVMCRPTKSLTLYTQVLGRGTRPLPGVVDGIEGAEERRTAIQMSAKPSMIVVDYAGNAGRHKIVQAADVLGGRYELPVREYAKRTMEEEGRKPVDLDDALERASDELALMEEENERRKLIKATQVAYRLQTISPFVRQHVGSGMKQKGEPASYKQKKFVAFLADHTDKPFSPEFIANLTKKQAQGLIGKLKAQTGL